MDIKPDLARLAAMAMAGGFLGPAGSFPGVHSSSHAAFGLMSPPISTMASSDHHQSAHNGSLARLSSMEAMSSPTDVLSPKHYSATSRMDEVLRRLTQQSAQAAQAAVLNALPSNSSSSQLSSHSSPSPPPPQSPFSRSPEDKGSPHATSPPPSAISLPSLPSMPSVFPTPMAEDDDSYSDDSQQDYPAPPRQSLPGIGALAGLSTSAATSMATSAATGIATSSAASVAANAAILSAAMQGAAAMGSPAAMAAAAAANPMAAAAFAMQQQSMVMQQQSMLHSPDVANSLMGMGQPSWPSTPSPNTAIARALSMTSSSRRPRSEKKAIPEDLKDGKYFERRKRNNSAAKKSRDARKSREDEIAIRASFLEKENAILRAQVATLRDEANSLRQLLLQKRSRPS